MNKILKISRRSYSYFKVTGEKNEVAMNVMYIQGWAKKFKKADLIAIVYSATTAVGGMSKVMYTS